MQISIASNQLDQVSKTHENEYGEIIDSLSRDIHGAFDRIVQVDTGDDVVLEKYVEGIFFSLPHDLLGSMKSGETATFLLGSKHHRQTAMWTDTPMNSDPVGVEKYRDIIGKAEYHHQKTKETIEKGGVGVFLVVKRKETSKGLEKQRDFEISAHLFHFPNTNQVMLPNQIINYKKLEGDAFTKAKEMYVD